MPKRTPDAKAVALRMAEESVGYRVRRLNRFVSRVFDHALQSQGLKTSQFALLAATELLAPVPPGELGSKIGLEKSTVSRNVRLLAEHGWIRIREGDDGRSQLLELTSRGRAKLLAAAPAWEVAEKQVERALGAETAGLLDRLLERCC